MNIICPYCNTECEIHSPTMVWCKNHKLIVFIPHDKNNNIIAGNGVVEIAGQIGMDKIRIIESDGTEIIALKRTDVLLDSKKGRELAIADNQTAKEGIID